MSSYSKTITDEMAILDRRSWNDMSLTWDDYTLTWDNYGELPITASVSRGHIFSETLTLTESIDRVHTIYRTLTDSISHTGSVVKKAIKVFLNSISLSPAIKKYPVKNLIDTITQTGSIEKKLIRNISDAITLAGSLVKNTSKNIADTIILSGSLARNTIKYLADAITLSGSILNSVIKNIIDTITHSETIEKIGIFGRTLTDSITHTEIFNSLLTTSREFKEWMTLDDLRKLIPIKTISETLTATESIAKITTKRISDTLHLTGVLTRSAIYIRTLLDTLNVSEFDWTWDKMTLTWDDYTKSWDEYRGSLWIRMVTQRTISDTLHFTGSLLPRLIKVFRDTITYSGTIRKIIKLVRLDTIVMSVNITTRANLGWIFTDSITLTENFLNKIRPFFAGVIARIRNEGISGNIKQTTLVGKISDAPRIIEGKITEFSPRGKVKDQTIIGKITTNQ